MGPSRDLPSTRIRTPLNSDLRMGLLKALWDCSAALGSESKDASSLILGVALPKCTCIFI